MEKLTEAKEKDQHSGTLSTVMVKDCSSQRGMWHPSTPAELGQEGVNSWLSRTECMVLYCYPILNVWYYTCCRVLNVWYFTGCSVLYSECMVH